jgi:bifunctional non-homologous end joining protein LigD
VGQSIDRVARDSRAKSGKTTTLTEKSFLERSHELDGDVTLRLGRTNVPLTSLGKLYWERERYSKGDLLAYYVRVGKLILPHLKGRPAILKRYPNGTRDDGFFQHDVTKAPDFLETAQLVSETGRTLNYAVYSDLVSLLYLVNIGTIAQNPWLSTVAHIDNPDYIVIDLDPKDAPFENVLATALNARHALEEVKLTCFAKTSGSTGIHLYVPIKPKYSFREAAAFAESIAKRVAEIDPRISTVERAVAERNRNQVYVDWLQNAHGKSAASVYSVRAKPGATVSAPVTWDEIERGFAIGDFTIATMPARIEAVGDLWRDFFTRRQRLPAH